MKALTTILLLLISNVFMTFAWYGHLQFQKIEWLRNFGLAGIIFISWFIALFEYIFQVPANRFGFIGNGGPFNMFELKTVQEALSLLVFVVINVGVFRGEKFAWNHALGFFLIFLAVYVIFKKW